MVLCPCVVMMPTCNSALRRDTKIPLPKTSHQLSFLATSEKEEINNILPCSKIRGISSAPTAYGGTYIPKPFINTQPTTVGQTGKVQTPSKLEMKSSQLQTSKKSIPRRGASPLGKQEAKKSESLVLANGNGRYVGTKPLKGKLLEVSPLHESKLRYGQPKTSVLTGNANPRSSASRGSELLPRNPSKPNPVPILETQITKEIHRENSTRNTKVAGRGTSLQRPTDFSNTTNFQKWSSNKTSNPIPSFNERRLQFRQNVRQNFEPTTIREKPVSTGLKNHLGTSTIPRRQLGARNDAFKRASLEIQLERDLQSYHVDNGTKLDDDYRNMLKLRRKSMSDEKASPNESIQPRNHEVKSSISDQLKFPNLISLNLPLKYKSEPTTESRQESLACSNSVSCLRSADRTVPFCSTDTSELVFENIPLPNVIENEEEHGENSESDPLGVFEMEDSFENNNFYDEHHKSRRLALSDIQEEGMMSRSEITFNEEAETLSSSSMESGEAHYERPEAEYEFPEDQPESRFERVMSPTPETDWHPIVDDLLLESFQNLQKEIKSLNKCVNSRNEKIRSFELNLTGNKREDEDESDYIDIDCDVPPMPALNRPFGYDFRNKISTRPMAEIPRYPTKTGETSRYSGIYDAYRPPMDVEERVSPQAQINFRETYWDYWLAKNKLQHLKMSKDLKVPESISATIGKHCCSADKVHYDPEILLAQVIHPKSLADATFSEYSSCIKASIMDRLILPNSAATKGKLEKCHQYGSCFEISEPAGSSISGPNDPGYFSESDVTKIRKQAHTGTLLDNSIAKYGHHRPKSYDSQLKSRSSADHTRRRLDPEEEADIDIVGQKDFPYSYNHYYANQNSKSFLDENPWTHLLPHDTTTLKPPVRELIQSQKDNQILTGRHSSILKPALIQQGELKHQYSNHQNSQFVNNNSIQNNFSARSNETLRQQTSANQLVFSGTPDMVSDNATSSPKHRDSTSVEAVRKTQKKSFLPTFLQKKKYQNQSNPSLSNKKTVVNNQQLSNCVADNSIDKLVNSQKPIPSTRQIKRPMATHQSATYQFDRVQNTGFSKPNLESCSNSSSSSSSTRSSQDSVKTVIPSKI